LNFSWFLKFVRHLLTFSGRFFHPDKRYQDKCNFLAFFSSLVSFPRRGTNNTTRTLAWATRASIYLWTPKNMKKKIKTKQTHVVCTQHDDECGRRVSTTVVVPRAARTSTTATQNISICRAPRSLSGNSNGKKCHRRNPISNSSQQPRTRCYFLFFCAICWHCFPPRHWRAPYPRVRTMTQRRKNHTCLHLFA